MGTIVYISFGSNLGDREQNITSAINKIGDHIGNVEVVSPIYTTPPFGFEAEMDFLNGCLKLDTNLSPTELLKELNKLEEEAGRVRQAPEKGYTSRPLDLDIILYGNEIRETPELQIPHPRFRERLFVLRPLCEIAPEIIDPVSAKTIQQLTNDCKDHSEVTIHQSKINAIV